MSGVLLRQRLLSGVAGAAVLVALGLNTPARAQSAPMPMWTGFYIGLNAGGAWGRSDISTSADCSPAPGTGYICDSAGTGAANAAALVASGTGRIDSSAFTGGIEAGFNYQMGSVVLGIETDFDAFGLGGTRQANGIFPVAGPVAPPGPPAPLPAGTAYAIATSVDTDWLWTFRGRVGLLVQPNLLVFATGGVAVTNLSVSFNYSDTNGVTGGGSASATKTGWVLGGGLEWAINNHWSVKGEYLYLDFGSVTANGTVGVPAGFKGAQSSTINTTADLTAHIARVGINYKF